MINHEKAKKLYEKYDPDKEALEMLTSQIHAAAAPGGSSLKSIISGIGWSFAYEEVKDAICALEAIYEVLQTEQKFIEKNKLNLKDKNKAADKDNIWSNDELFNIAFDEMYKTAETYRDDLPSVLQEYYLKNEHEQVQALGEDSNGIDNIHE